MPFDAKLAHRVTLDDRDIAPFFAGRKAEIGSFEDALEASKLKEQAVFRIYQGAPGSGKTSLAHHLSGKLSDRIAFVRISPAEELSLKSLGKKLRNEWMKNAFTPQVGDLVVAACAHLAGEALTEAAVNAIATAKRKGHSLVIHIDEAHEFPKDSELALRSLHQVGAEVPCVVLLTGLEHTAERITSIRGLSRLSSDAVNNMGPLEDEACAQSTRKMLQALGNKEDLCGMAEFAAELSRGWPAHLHSAQRAICENLIEVDGNYRGLDFEAVENRADELRHQYYEARMAHAIFQRDRALTNVILKSVDDHKPEDLPHLGEICFDLIGKHAKKRRGFLSVTPEMSADFAQSLVEKGIVTTNQETRRYELAIPSMAEWAEQKIKQDAG